MFQHGDRETAKEACKALAAGRQVRHVADVKGNVEGGCRCRSGHVVGFDPHRQTCLLQYVGQPTGLLLRQRFKQNRGGLVQGVGDLIGWQP